MNLWVVLEEIPVWEKKKYSSWKINDKKNSRPIKLLTTNLSDKLSWTYNLWLEKNLLMVWYVVLS